MRDVPSSDYPVVVMLQVRRFFCQHPDCPQHTFAERLPDVVAARARRTLRCTHRLRAIGNAVGAAAGARLAQRLLFRTSTSTVLRIVRANPLPTMISPRVVGVDDFALRKGKNYGTLLVDLEQRCPIAISG